MRHLTLLIGFLFCIAPAHAQEEDIISAIQAVPTANEETVSKDITPPTENPDLKLKDDKAREYEDAPLLRLRILDKVRAESRTYELNVGRTVAYSNLRIRPRACRRSSPLDTPESAAFLQIWEVKPDESSAWVFSGWMFASSPSLSGMDHPVYDVTVLECKFPESAKEDDKKKDDDAADQADGAEEPAADETAPSENETSDTPSADDSSD